MALLATDQPRRSEDASECFARAADIAARQGARILLLRAELARGRHRGQSSPAADEPERVSALYASFTEGIDTPDLLDAAAFIGRRQAARS
jgi:hypothetical protein